MDLRQVRKDLGVVAGEAGFSAWDYVPDDPQDLPAAVVGGLSLFERLNAIVTKVNIGITFYVDLSDAQDAAARLDLVLSTGMPNSFIDWLDSVTSNDLPAWRSVRFLSAGPYNRYTMPGGAVALGVEVTLEITA